MGDCEPLNPRRTNGDDRKIVILGCAGSGKTTFARDLATRHRASILNLDDVAWEPGPTRRPLEESLLRVQRFTDSEPSWIIEGCYADIAREILDGSMKLYFLNPGVDVCAENCRHRPWEPAKFATRTEQNAMLPTLLKFVKEYEARDDEYGLKSHREVFDSFEGEKVEYTSLLEYRRE